MAVLSILLRTFFVLIKHCAPDFWKMSRHWDMSPRISALRLGPREVCKIWHIPPRLMKERLNASDPRWKRVCLECLDTTRYVKKQVKKKKNLDEPTTLKRQTPSSHFPWRYLSPASKTKRARNILQQRSRLSKHVQRFYKQAKIGLPGEQLRNYVISSKQLKVLR